jgi:hypothetical protein
MISKFAISFALSVATLGSARLSVCALEPQIATPNTVTNQTAKPTSHPTFSAAETTAQQPPTSSSTAAQNSAKASTTTSGSDHSVEAPKKPWVHSDAPITETWNIHGDRCTVTYDQPEESSAEAQALFAQTRDGLKAEMTGNLGARSAMLDDNFTIEHEREGQKPKIICGKEAALEAMKEESDNMAKHPPSSIEFYYPMAMIYGDSAVVNYKCLVIGRGDEPRYSYGWVTNVFVKRADSWKQLHHRSHWKVVHPGTQPSHSSATTPASSTKDAAKKD